MEKTINESLFDVTMWSYDGAETLELVGLHILSILGELYRVQKVGLYDDDGLAWLNRSSGQVSEKNTERTHQNFSGEHKLSTHPPNIIKALPDSISKRVSNISSDKATFVNAVPFYNDVLSASGYEENLAYQKDLPSSNDDDNYELFLRYGWPTKAV